MSINEWDEETNHDYEEKMSLGLLDEEDGCKGYSSFNGESTEYDCEYEFADDCGSCMFGNHGGKNDPRVDPNKEDEEELPECTECKYHEQEYVPCRFCKVLFHENETNHFEQKEEVV